MTALALAKTFLITSRGSSCILFADVSCAVLASGVALFTDLETARRSSKLGSGKVVVWKVWGLNSSFNIQKICVTFSIWNSFPVVGGCTLDASILQGAPGAIWSTVLTLHSVRIGNIIMSKVLTPFYTHRCHILFISLGAHPEIIIERKLVHSKITDVTLCDLYICQVKVSLRFCPRALIASKVKTLAVNTFILKQDLVRRAVWINPESCPKQDKQKYCKTPR